YFNVRRADSFCESNRIAVNTSHTNKKYLGVLICLSPLTHHYVVLRSDAPLMARRDCRFKMR
ncbi:MAG TPA: hypothetical protein VL528_11695, partial [Oxalicibacterium sp.]|nr:hypothetical protein [Oxalicibacterium sp.]